ncbi:related to BRT1 protein, down-regulated by mating factor B [Rhynchosporium agropyri]|uniref:Related to BRT1 protein, down-regulated by mating factor B n=1 Tax=Rhynchosporium agropyri TaxID=914238 RepID=A0A1E1JRW4_9HELO|nr:related to BRT1 protein, down-regulated by mating factor B [Rhynchosporium agropyri]
MFTLRRAIPRLPKSKSFAISQSVAVRSRSFRSSSRFATDITPILSKNAMLPVGPYQSQAIKTPHAIYCSGQLPADSQGNAVEGTMGDRTAACLKALSTVLIEAGSSIDRIVKVQIFLTDMKDFAEMNDEYEKWIKHKPARTCVAVKQLPKDVDIEIECVALP